MPEAAIDVHAAFIGLGSNLEPRHERLRAAVRGIQEFASVTHTSAIYETAPVGHLAQPHFLNAAIRVETQDGPIELLHKLRDLESRLGRQQRPRWHEREIDCDLLFYEDLVLRSGDDLTIPHPEIANRVFVLRPLADCAVDFVHPVLHRTIGELLQSLDGTGVTRTSLSLL